MRILAPLLALTIVLSGCSDKPQPAAPKASAGSKPRKFVPRESDPAAFQNARLIQRLQAQRGQAVPEVSYERISETSGQRAQRRVEEILEAKRQARRQAAQPSQPAPDAR